MKKTRIERLVEAAQDQGKPTFFRLHTHTWIGSFSRSFTSVRNLAVEILRDLNDRQTSLLRLTELQYNEERTAGKPGPLQDIKLRFRPRLLKLAR